MLARPALRVRVSLPGITVRRYSNGTPLDRITVPIKRVVDYSVKIRVKSDGSGVHTDNVKMSMNPFDEIAVTEAVKLKEQGKAKEVVAVSIGGKKVVETLRTALAMGADRAVHVDVEDEALLQPLGVAKALAALMNSSLPSNLVILGKQAIDDDANQVGQLLAGLMNWPMATFASGVDLAGNEVKVTREVDAGLEVLKMPLPAVISVDLRLNTPKRCTLQNILAANKKKVDVVTPAQLKVDLKPRLQQLKVADPPVRKAGKKVDSFEELVGALKKEGFISG